MNKYLNAGNKSPEVEKQMVYKKKDPLFRICKRIIDGLFCPIKIPKVVVLVLGS